MSCADLKVLLQGTFFASGKAESDLGFRKVLLSHLRLGMRVGGTLALLGTLALVLGDFLAGKHFALTYGQHNAVVLWDKIAIFSLGAILIVLAPRTQSLPQSLALLTLLVLTISLLSLLDDAGNGDLRSSPLWLTLILVVVVGAVPYTAAQMLMLSGAIMGLYVVVVPVLVPVLGFEVEAMFGQREVVFMLILSVTCTGISGLLYRTRYRQYQERQRAEALHQKVKAQARRLQMLEAAKDRFFANISHEFRTPLTLIFGPIHDALTGRYGDLPPTLRQQLHVMARNGQRLLSQINALLDLSKQEAGEMQLRAYEQDVTPLLRRIIASFSPLVDRNHVDLLFTPEVDDKPYVLCVDPEKLEQVVTNLLSNAFKFTPAGGRIQLSLGEGDDASGAFVVLTVRDSGTGIRPEELPFIFDHFHQAPGATQGTGIGLALSKAITERHGGRVDVESTVGFGSTFTVRLPRGHAHLDPGDLVTPGLAQDHDLDPSVHWSFPEDQIALEDDHLLAPLDAPLVLIVEDHSDVRAYLKSHLAPHYRVLEAADGQSGLEQARATPPDLILSDVIMPEMDGYALCRAVKADERLSHIPIILLTARADDADRLEGLQTGADDYIIKPFNASILLARVENLIEVRRQLQARFAGEVVIRPTDVTVPSAEAAFLARVQAIVEAHLANANFGVDWLAEEVGLSPRHLQRRLRAATRLSAAGFIRMMRLQRAAQLLEQRSGSIAEVAYAVGFHDANYFSRLFRQTFGVVPSKYMTDQAE